MEIKQKSFLSFQKFPEVCILRWAFLLLFLDLHYTITYTVVRGKIIMECSNGFVSQMYKVFLCTDCFNTVSYQQKIGLHAKWLLFHMTEWYRYIWLATGLQLGYIWINLGYTCIPLLTEWHLLWGQQHSLDDVLWIKCKLLPSQHSSGGMINSTTMHTCTEDTFNWT